jgi:hypothetical protein
MFLLLLNKSSEQQQVAEASHIKNIIKVLENGELKMFNTDTCKRHLRQMRYRFLKQGFG